MFPPERFAKIVGKSLKNWIDQNNFELQYKEIMLCKIQITMFSLPKFNNNWFNEKLLAKNDH